MTSTAQKSYDQLCQHVREIGLLNSVESLLGWDERTLLPPEAGEYRAEQQTLLAGLLHDRWTDPRMGEWLDELSDSPLATDPESDSGANLRQIRRKYDRKVKLPKTLVEELTRTSVLGQQVWQQARGDDDFAAFRPMLEKTVDLKRQEAEALGYPECPYDALLDDYEPGELTSNVRRILGGLRDALVPLIAAIAECGRQADLSIMSRDFPVDVQDKFSRRAAAKIGFDFSSGRLDLTTHPFCSTMGPHDCRITTRYHKDDFGDGFFSVLHEAGHGIYEQGLRADQFGLPLGDSTSLGIHESQSRMWENQVGRGRAFWEHFYPDAQAAFPTALGGVSFDDFYFAANAVRPSLIRCEADEATYNLHVLIRFELEQALIDDQLPVAELPGAWNEKYRDYLGIKPPSDADGVLQDIHWSAGLFGYFATYSLGNLYAAQLFKQADADLGGLDAQFRRGEFGPLRDWLRAKIHVEGQRYTAAQLVQRATGRPLSHDDLMEYLNRKLGQLYGLST